VIGFYHRQLAERAGVGLHAELARYFRPPDLGEVKLIRV
jgi:hypothetical protein